MFDRGAPIEPSLHLSPKPVRHEQRQLASTLPRLLAGGVWLVLAASHALAQSSLRIVADQPSYNVGSEVFVRLSTPPGVEGPAHATSAEFVAAIRYAGEDRPVASGPLLPRGTRVSRWRCGQAPWPISRLGCCCPAIMPTAAAGFLLPGDALLPVQGLAKDFVKLWRVPPDARLGRYEIDLQQKDPRTHQILSGIPDAASFTVYQKLVRIDELKLDDKTFYTSEDPVSAAVTIENLTDRPLRGLRVEFSDRYWPWIAGPAENARASVVVLARSLDLAPREKRELRADKIAVAPDVKKPSTRQYGVVVWNQDRQTVLDISFSQLAFVHRAAVDSPIPYPGQYAYPDLASLNTTDYRQFQPPESGSSAIQFDRNHTMFAPGAETELRFSLRNPTSAAWHAVSGRVRLLGPQGAELMEKAALVSTDLNPAGPPLSAAVKLSLPSQPGLYRAVVELKDPSGNIVSAKTLELGVNPLPKSVLIFCAHEDDEGSYLGLTRAALENHIPVRFVYFTSGDAGSCDRYYEHSCNPAEASYFGSLRMAEARASLGHLGVPAEAINFMGLPDGGSGMIWYDHRRAPNPFLDPLLATDHAPYEGLLRVNLPFARDSVVEAVKELVRKFQPEMICTAHPPSVGHIDHIVNNYFVVKALQELLHQGYLSPDLTLLVDRVYDPKAQPKTPYHYRDRDFYVSGEVAGLAQEAWWFYQSQGGNRAQGKIVPLSKLPRKESLRQILDWSEHEGWNDKR
jgi:LmbE family N-acetylglucosaminyl deacetylase